MVPGDSLLDAADVADIVRWQSGPSASEDITIACQWLNATKVDQGILTLLQQGRATWFIKNNEFAIEMAENEQPTP